MRKAALMLLLIATAQWASAQTGRYDPRDYAREPVWMAMIGDTTANYYEAQKAFDAYFRNHELPEGEHDVIGEKREREKRLNRRARRRINAENKLRIAVKKYYWWRDHMAPYVQEDGRILFPSERLAIHAEQMRARK